MNNSFNNFQFNYLYRDAGNYKKFGRVIFTSQVNHNIDDLEFQIRSKLIDGEYFDPMQLNIESLCFENINDDDHSWHEFESISQTAEKPTDLRFLEEFLNTMQVMHS